MKIKRDSFIYLDPKGPKEQKDLFAQCATCVFWTGEKKTCTLHGKDVEVTGDMSCDFYIHGEPGPNPEHKRVTPEESGLVKRPVRCENCKFYDEAGSVCRLFRGLNQAFPETYDLDEIVDKHGCCNAQTPSAAKEMKNKILGT